MAVAGRPHPRGGNQRVTRALRLRALLRQAVRRAAPWFWLIVTNPACSSQQSPALKLTLQDGKLIQINPRSSYAEYLELPGIRNELRITLASYETSCDQFVMPNPRDTLVTVTLAFPPGESPAQQEYFATEPSPPKDAVTRLERSTASVFVRRGNDAVAFQSGGGLRLNTVMLKDHGTIAGDLGFESGGPGDQAALRLIGQFRAGICRFHASASAPAKLP